MGSLCGQPLREPSMVELQPLLAVPFLMMLYVLLDKELTGG